MKKKITRLCAAALMLSAGIAFPTVIQAQRVNTFTVEQQTRIDSLKQGYIKKGVPAHWAEKRATMIVEQESKAQLRASVRPATPNTGSIKIVEALRLDHTLPIIQLPRGMIMRIIW